MMLKKCLNFFYFQWQKVDQVRSEYLRSYLNWLHNLQHATIPLRKAYRMSLISAGSISLDSTFNVFQFPDCRAQ